jgi:hypothetical protein
LLKTNVAYFLHLINKILRFIELYDAPGYHMDPNTDDGFSTEVDDFHLLFP